MTDRDAMLAHIRRTYAARDSGDLEGLLAAFHPEARYTLIGDSRALALTGTIADPGNLREQFGGFIAAFTFSNRRILSEVADGDRAAVHSRFTVRFEPTGEVRETDVINLMQFRDGKIVALDEFADTAMIRDMITPGP